MKLKRVSRGFTLLEVLAALGLFALGMLSVAMFTGKAIKTSLNDSVRATALYVASQSVGQFVVAAGIGANSGARATNLRNAIIAFDEDGDMQAVSRSAMKGNNDKDNFTVIITAAQDGGGTDILADPNPGAWVSPINMAVRVVYEDDQNMAVRANYTIVF